jgi:hypothetical protein
MIEVEVKLQGESIHRRTWEILDLCPEYVRLVVKGYLAKKLMRSSR